MADHIDIIQKLMALALNNPNRNEALAAAMKAVSLIVEKEVTLGGKPALGYQAAAAKAWAPDPEFDAFWERMKQQGQPQSTEESYVDGTYSSGGTSSGLKASTSDTDLDDDFMRKRITWAWRAIRAERIRLERWIQEQTAHYREKYPRPHAKDWTP